MARVARLWGTEDPQDAFKARIVAVMVLHDRGIDDAETLSIANRLDTVNAISFAVELVQHGMDLEGDALRNSDVVRNARAAINPGTRNSPFVQAYVPALPAKAFNDVVATGLRGSSEKLPETFQLLRRSTADAVRARYGADGYPDVANFSFLVDGIDTKALTGADNPGAPRITPETLCDRLMEAAVDSSARRFMYKSVSGRHLLDLLDANAPADQIYAEMAVIMGPLCAAKDQIFATARAQGRTLGPDDTAGILSPMVSIVVLSQPGLEEKLSKFLSRDDVRVGLNDDRTAQVLISFLDFRREPGANADLAAKIGTDELPAFHAKAIADAVRAEAGLRFAKDPAGNIRLTVTQTTNAQMVLDNRDPQHPVHHHMPAGSTYKFQITITLPEENLSELAEADWTHYDRKTVNDFDGTMDGRVALIPEPCRFSKAPSTSSSTSTNPKPPPTPPPKPAPPGGAGGPPAEPPPAP